MWQLECIYNAMDTHTHTHTSSSAIFTVISRRASVRYLEWCAFENQVDQHKNRLDFSLKTKLIGDGIAIRFIQSAVDGRGGSLPGFLD